MRKNQSTLLLTLAIIAASLWALLPSASAQPAIRLIPYNQEWQYFQEGTAPPDVAGVNWKATNYNDSAWSTGPGLFVYEPDTPWNYIHGIGTTLNRTAPAGGNVLSYYFRTHFNFPVATNNVILNFANVFDDGGVVYLNGVEVFRLRMPPTGTPVYNTSATGGPAIEGGEDIVIRQPVSLRRGDNVLAVEVHDSGTASSDIAWGLGLSYTIGAPPVITRQATLHIHPTNYLIIPPSQINRVTNHVITPANVDLTLGVRATGSYLRYQWFRNNTVVTGTPSTNSTLILPNIGVGQGGTYHVVVSNLFGSVRSSNVVVSVLADTSGPRLLDAVVLESDDDRIFLIFDEDPMRIIWNTNYSAMNPTNYFITQMGTTDRIWVSNVAAQAGAGLLRLTLATNLIRGTNYQICINNLSDGRTNLAVPFGNLIAPNTCVPVGFEVTTNPIPYKSFWFYNEWGESLDDSRLTNWTALNYVEDPNRWVEAQGLFAYNTNNSPCTDPGWIMSIGPNTYYFRKEFILATNWLALTQSLHVTLGHAIDEGAIFYLNGREIYRHNMPAEFSTFYTKGNAGDDVCRTNILVDLPLARTNILAVEVHQAGISGINDWDAVFDASLKLRHIRYPVLPQPTNQTGLFTNVLRIARHTTNQVRVYYTNGFGWTLQHKTNLNDFWQEYQPATTNLIITNTISPRRFWSLEKAH